jgi:toxin-antitoxin system PIN domain toxin
VKIVDLNVLLYAVNRDSPQHSAAKAWMEDTLSGDEPVGLPWIVLLGFLRVATNRRVFANALDVEDALAVVDSWLAQPAVVRVVPGDHHWNTLKDLVAESGTAGNLTTDAHLAALALENGAELCSTDSDFARFPRLRWRNPLSSRR